MRSRPLHHVQLSFTLEPSELGSAGSERDIQNITGSLHVSADGTFRMPHFLVDFAFLCRLNDVCVSFGAMNEFILW